MVREEVYLALLVFFHKIVKYNYAVHDLKIRLAAPQKLHIEPLMLLNSDVSFPEMKKRVGNVLLKAFELLIDTNNCVNNDDRYLLIRAEALMLCIRKLQKNYRS